MTVKNVDILCNQVIDVALVVKETKETISNASLSIYPHKFIERINSVLGYCHTLFVNCNNDIHTDEEVNDLLINLMNTLVKYKNSYNEGTYGFKVMNSLLDIVKNTFVELN